MAFKKIPVFLAFFLLSCQANFLFEPVPKGLESSNLITAIKLRGIWVLGGQTSSYNLGYPTSANVLGQVDLYDPLTNTWYPNVTQLPLPVTFMGATYFNGKIYVSGGWDKEGVVRNELQIYDISQNKWQFGPAMPEPRASHDLIFLDNYIYATGGLNTNHSTGYNFRNQWFRFDPVQKAWIPRLGFGLVDSSYVVAGGIIRAMGGRNPAATIQNYHDGYYPTPSAITDTTTTATAEQPIQRMFFSSVSYIARDYNSYIIAFGGIINNLAGTWRSFVFHDLSSNTSILTNVISYLRAPYEAPAAWLNLPVSLNQAIAFHRTILYDRGVYLMGGSKTLPNPSPTDENWFFNLDNFPTSVPAPTLKAPMPVGRYGHQLVSVLE